MAVKRHLIPTNWEQQVAQKLGDIGRRLIALERKRGVPQRAQWFLFFTGDGSLPVNWHSGADDITIGSFYQDDDGEATVTFALNGAADVSPPFDMSVGDRVVVTATGVVNPGLGVTLTEEVAGHGA